jgi:hypothetical protein
LKLTRTTNSTLPSNSTGGPGFSTVKPGGSSVGSQGQAGVLKIAPKKIKQSTMILLFMALVILWPVGQQDPKNQIIPSPGHGLFIANNVPSARFHVFT